MNEVIQQPIYLGVEELKFTPLNERPDCVGVAWLEIEGYKKLKEEKHPNDQVDRERRLSRCLFREVFPVRQLIRQELSTEPDFENLRLLCTVLLDLKIALRPNSGSNIEAEFNSVCIQLDKIGIVNIESFLTEYFGLQQVSGNEVKVVYGALNMLIDTGTYLSDKPIGVSYLNAATYLDTRDNPESNKFNNYIRDTEKTNVDGLFRRMPYSNEIHYPAKLDELRKQLVEIKGLAYILRARCLVDTDDERGQRIRDIQIHYHQARGSLVAVGLNGESIEKFLMDYFGFTERMEGKEVEGAPLPPVETPIPIEPRGESRVRVEVHQHPPEEPIPPNCQEVLVRLANTEEDLPEHPRGMNWEIALSILSEDLQVVINGERAEGNFGREVIAVVGVLNELHLKDDDIRKADHSGKRVFEVTRELTLMKSIAYRMRYRKDQMVGESDINEHGGKAVRGLQKMFPELDVARFLNIYFGFRETKTPEVETEEVTDYLGRLPGQARGLVIGLAQLREDDVNVFAGNVYRLYQPDEQDQIVNGSVLVGDHAYTINITRVPGEGLPEGIDRNEAVVFQIQEGNRTECILVDGNNRVYIQRSIDGEQGYLVLGEASDILEGFIEDVRAEAETRTEARTIREWFDTLRFEAAKPEDESLKGRIDKEKVDVIRDFLLAIYQEEEFRPYIKHFLNTGESGRGEDRYIELRYGGENYHVSFNRPHESNSCLVVSVLRVDREEGAVILHIDQNRNVTETNQADFIRVINTFLNNRVGATSEQADASFSVETAQGLAGWFGSLQFGREEERKEELPRVDDIPQPRDGVIIQLGDSLYRREVIPRFPVDELLDILTRDEQINPVTRTCLRFLTQKPIRVPITFISLDRSTVEFELAFSRLNDGSVRFEISYRSSSEDKIESNTNAIVIFRKDGSIIGENGEDLDISSSGRCSTIFDIFRIYSIGFSKLAGCKSQSIKALNEWWKVTIERYIESRIATFPLVTREFIGINTFNFGRDYLSTKHADKRIQLKWGIALRYERTDLFYSRTNGNGVRFSLEMNGVDYHVVIGRNRTVDLDPLYEGGDIKASHEAFDMVIAQARTIAMGKSSQDLKTSITREQAQKLVAWYDKLIWKEETGGGDAGGSSPPGPGKPPPPGGEESDAVEAEIPEGFPKATKGFLAIDPGFAKNFIEGVAQPDRVDFGITIKWLGELQIGNFTMQYARTANNEVRLVLSNTGNLTFHHVIIRGDGTIISDPTWDIDFDATRRDRSFREAREAFNAFVAQARKVAGGQADPNITQAQAQAQRLADWYDRLIWAEETGGGESDAGEAGEVKIPEGFPEATKGFLRIDPQRLVKRYINCIPQSDEGDPQQENRGVKWFDGFNIGGNVVDYSRAVNDGLRFRLRLAGQMNWHHVIVRGNGIIVLDPAWPSEQMQESDIELVRNAYNIFIAQAREVAEGQAGITQEQAQRLVEWYGKLIWEEETGGGNVGSSSPPGPGEPPHGGHKDGAHPEVLLRLTAEYEGEIPEQVRLLLDRVLGDENVARFNSINSSRLTVEHCIEQLRQGEEIVIELGLLQPMRIVYHYRARLQALEDNGEVFFSVSLDEYTVRDNHQIVGNTCTINIYPDGFITLPDVEDRLSIWEGVIQWSLSVRLIKQLDPTSASKCCKERTAEFLSKWQEEMMNSVFTLRFVKAVDDLGFYRLMASGSSREDVSLRDAFTIPELYKVSFSRYSIYDLRLAINDIGRNRTVNLIVRQNRTVVLDDDLQPGQNATEARIICEDLSKALSQSAAKTRIGDRNRPERAPILSSWFEGLEWGEVPVASEAEVPVHQVVINLLEILDQNRDLIRDADGNGFEGINTGVLEVGREVSLSFQLYDMPYGNSLYPLKINLTRTKNNSVSIFFRIEYPGEVIEDSFTVLQEGKISSESIVHVREIIEALSKLQEHIDTRSLDIRENVRSQFQKVVLDIIERLRTDI